MPDINLDPVIGEEVRIKGRPGTFRIIFVRQPGEEYPNPNLRTSETRLGTVDLKREEDGFVLAAIPWHRLAYVDQTRPVRRVIEWLKSDPDGHRYPDYILDYEVTSGDDHAGNPSIFVRFLVAPDYVYENGKPSEEKIAGLNQFLEDVQKQLLYLDLDRWTYVRAAEARGALDVAS